MSVEERRPELDKQIEAMSDDSLLHAARPHERPARIMELSRIACGLHVNIDIAEITDSETRQALLVVAAGLRDKVALRQEQRRLQAENMLANVQPPKSPYFG